MSGMPNMKRMAPLIAAALVGLAAPGTLGTSLGAAFTYQGELDDNGTLVIGGSVQFSINWRREA